MHFGFPLDFSDIDLLNVDLLDQRYTRLDLFVSKTSWRRLEDMSSRRLQDISSRRLQDMSSRCLEDMSSRRLEEVFRVTIFRLPRRLQDVFKTSSRRFAKCLQDVFKTSSRRLGRRKIVMLKTYWRHLQDMSWRRLRDVLKTNKCLLGTYSCIDKHFILK